jgi:hypothetical protein
LKDGTKKATIKIVFEGWVDKSLTNKKLLFIIINRKKHEMSNSYLLKEINLKEK